MASFISVFRNNWIVNTLRLFREAFGAYALQIITIMVLAIVGSVCEGVGISAIVPTFSFVGGGGGAATDIVTHFIEVLFSYAHVTYTFRYLLVFIAILFTIRTLVLFVIQYLTARIVFGYERDMREKLFASTIRADWPFLSQQKMGSLSQMLITNTTNAAQFFTYFSILVVIGTKLVAYTLITINISPIMALLSVLFGGFTFYVIKPIYRRSRDLSAMGEKMNRNISHFVSQHIAGMKTVKAMAVEPAIAEHAGEYFESNRTYGVAILTYRGFIQMLIAFAGLAFIGLTFLIMYKMPGFQISTFIVMVYAINQLFSQIQLSQAQIHSMIALMPFLNIVLEQVHEAEQSAETEDGEVSPVSIERGIEFSHVSFSYPKRGQILTDISFNVLRGRMVGIIGPSGAGKTTVADLLLRLYPPESGGILLDGRDIREQSLRSWRSSIGYVTQDMFLLNDTLLHNIVFYDKNITRDDVVAAAKLANIHDFIETLPDKYDTIIGDRGVLLSGGQRQRIALARILARKPALLILDEATSALDSESERAVQETIERLHDQVTVIVIAHRLSTIEHADMLIVLKDGKVVEQGTPTELRADTSSYFHNVHDAHSQA